jgi:hypothetical protein
MEIKNYSEQEQALLRAIDRVLNSRLSWAKIERWVGCFSGRLAEVRTAAATPSLRSSHGMSADETEVTHGGSCRARGVA